MTLAEQPKDISLLDVIAAVEPLKRARGKSRSAPSTLQRTLDEALVQVRETFANVSLADMLTRAPRKKKTARQGKKKAKGAKRKRAKTSKS